MSATFFYFPSNLKQEILFAILKTIHSAPMRPKKNTENVEPNIFKFKL